MTWSSVDEWDKSGITKYYKQNDSNLGENRREARRGKEIARDRRKKMGEWKAEE